MGERTQVYKCLAKDETLVTIWTAVEPGMETRYFVGFTSPRKLEEEAYHSPLQPLAFR